MNLGICWTTKDSEVGSFTLTSVNPESRTAEEEMSVAISLPADSVKFKQMSGYDTCGRCVGSLHQLDAGRLNGHVLSNLHVL